MTAIRTVIVDDERLARRRLRRLLAAEPDIEVIAECEDGRQALECLTRHQADLLFLDVQMPVMDGFGLLQALGTGTVPVVVFVTAYDEYALRAFQVHALDYLLKPFDRPRLSETLRRARVQIGYMRAGRGREDRLAALIAELRSQRKTPGRLAVKSNDRVFLVPMEQIDWIEAADNYVCVHVGPETHVLRETMNSIESRLDPERFVRIHRSAIVNADRIKELRPWFHGEYQVILANGKQLTLSRGYRDKALSFLGR